MGKPTLEWFDNNFVPINTADYMVMISDHPELGPMVAEIELPSRAINRVRIELFGKSRAVPGRRISSDNELNATLLIDRGTQTYQHLIALQDSFSEPETGNIVGKTFSIRSILYDGAGEEAIIITFTDCWLAEVGSLQISSQNDAQIAQVQCVFCYARAGYEFTGIGGSTVNTTIISRLTDGPLSIGSTDRFGSFPAMVVNRVLEGQNPVLRISQIRQELASIIGFSMEDLQSMRNVINAVRGAIDGTTSKTGALMDAARQITSGTALGSAVSSLNRIRSLF